MVSILIYKNNYKKVKCIEGKIKNYSFFVQKCQYFFPKKYFDLRKFVHIRTYVSPGIHTIYFQIQGH